MQLVGVLLETMDPATYIGDLIHVREVCEFSPWKIFNTSRRCSFLGVALLRNLRCRPHRDKSDSLHGWAVQTVIGTFSGGHLVVPELEIKIQIEPGDILFFKSALLIHFVEEYVGKRSSMVFFTHDSVYSFSTPS